MIYKSNYFEDLGLYYMGPYNGNDYATVAKALTQAKALKRSVLLHLTTVKGKGYAPAEENPRAYHCLYPTATDGEKFYQVFGQSLMDLAAEDSTICAITPATPTTTGLAQFSETYPDRFFDVGIAEAHAVTFSAALAATGKKPYAVIYSSFLQRGYDQIVHDIALQNLPVHFMIDRASLAPADGATHHGVYDVAMLMQIPNIRILAPATFAALRQMLLDTKDSQGPVAIRYANVGEDEQLLQAFYPAGDTQDYAPKYYGSKTPEVVFVAYGVIAKTTLAAVHALENEGVNVGMILLQEISCPTKVVEQIDALLPANTPVVYVEEGVYHGGAAMATTAALAQMRPDVRCYPMAIMDPTATPKTLMDIRAFHGISKEDIVAKAKEILSK